MNAQISVSATGNVKIAGDLNIIPYTGNTCSIYPDETNMAYCGASSKQFYKIYGQTIYSNGTPLSSDKRLKENFRSIDNALSKVLQMTGKKYDLIPERSDSMGTEKEKKEKANLKKDKLGFVAQELKEILPEVIVYDEEIDRYYIEYSAIIPVIVEAMKEQNAKIETLEKEIRSLKSASNLKSDSIVPLDAEDEQTATMGQNIPNPFSETTRIAITLPQSINQATLYLYNMQGVQMKSFVITERGNTNVTIEGNSLKAGMYMYTLIADGKEVDTKKMILTK